MTAISLPDLPMVVALLFNGNSLPTKGPVRTWTAAGRSSGPLVCTGCKGDAAGGGGGGGRRPAVISLTMAIGAVLAPDDTRSAMAAVLTWLFWNATSFP